MENGQRIILPPGNLLSYNPGQIHHRYGVLINYPEKQVSVHYEIICQYQQDINDTHFSILMDRKQVFVNNEVPEMKLYQIAETMAKAFYPIDLYIRKTDLIIRKIGNHPQIITRCQQAEQLLGNQYEGPLASSFFEQFNRQYSNINILTDRLKNELFCKLYFFPLYKNYSPELTAVSEMYFPFNTDQDDPLLEITHQIIPYHTSDGKIKIDLKGAPLSSETSLAQKVDGIGFEACYHLYADDHTISAVTGKAFHNFNEGKKTTVEFEVYHLDPEQRHQETNTTASDTNAKTGFTAPDEVKKKKSFWNIFN